MKKPIVIYDNTCHFCTGTKNIFSKIDKKTKWVGVNKFNNKNYSNIGKIKKESLLKEIHLISNGKIYKGYYAFKEMSRKNPFLIIFYIISLIPGVDFVGTRIYRLISKHRYKL